MTVAVSVGRIEVTGAVFEGTVTLGKDWLVGDSDGIAYDDGSPISSFVAPWTVAAADDDNAVGYDGAATGEGYDACGVGAAGEGAIVSEKPFGGSPVKCGGL